jgi:hypothetical protein
MENGAMRENETKTGFFLLLFALVSLNSCSGHPDPEEIAGQLEKHPGVKQVVFVAVEPGDWFDTVAVGILLDNDAIISIFGLGYRLGTGESYIMDIGSCHFQYSYYDYDKKREIPANFITLKEIEQASGHKFWSLKSVIRNFDVILAAIKKIHLESS